MREHVGDRGVGVVVGHGRIGLHPFADGGDRDRFRVRSDREQPVDREPGGKLADSFVLGGGDRAELGHLSEDRDQIARRAAIHRPVFSAAATDSGFAL